jgi:hypothetical protein
MNCANGISVEVGNNQEAYIMIDYVVLADSSN